MICINRLLLSLYMIAFSATLKAAPFEAYVAKNLYGKGLYNALMTANKKTKSLDINNIAIVEHQLEKNSTYKYEDLLLMPFQAKKEHLEAPLMISMISLIKDQNNLALMEQRLGLGHGWDYPKAITTDFADKTTALKVAAKAPEPVKPVDEDAVKAVKEDNMKELQELIRTKYAGKTYGDFYGPKISEILKDSPCIKQQINDFPGLNHLLYPEAVKSEADQRFRKVVGFHLDSGLRLLNANLYSLKDLEDKVGGMYVATLIYDKLVKVGKSFFPSTWSITDLLDKISLLCHDPKTTADRHRGLDYVSVVGTVPEGFNVNITLKNDCGIFTAFPVAP